MPKIHYNEIYQNNQFYEANGPKKSPSYLSQLSSMISALCSRIYDAISSLFEEKAQDLPTPPPPLQGRVTLADRPNKKSRNKRKQRASLNKRVKPFKKKSEKLKKLESQSARVNKGLHPKFNREIISNNKQNTLSKSKAESEEKGAEGQSIDNSDSLIDFDGVHEKQKEEKESLSKDKSLQTFRENGLSLPPYSSEIALNSIPAVSQRLATSADSADSPLPPSGHIHPFSALFSHTCHHNPKRTLQNYPESYSKEDLVKSVELTGNQQSFYYLSLLGDGVLNGIKHVSECMLPARSTLVHNYVMENFVIREIEKIDFSPKTKKRLTVVINSPQAQQIFMLVPKLMSGPVSEFAREIFNDIKASILNINYTETFDGVVVCINQHSNKLISIKNRTDAPEITEKEILEIKYRRVANKILALGFCDHHLGNPERILDTSAIPVMRDLIETFLKNQLRNTARKREFLDPLLVRTILPNTFETTINKFIQMILQNSKKIIEENEAYKTYQEFKAYNSEFLDEFVEQESKGKEGCNPNQGMGAIAFYNAKDKLRQFLWTIIQDYYTPFSSADEGQLAEKINALIPQLHKILGESPSEEVPADKGVGNDIMSLVNNLGFELGDLNKGGIRKPIVGNILKQLLKLQTTDEMVKNKIIASLNTYRKDPAELLKQVADNLIPMFDGSFLDRMMNPNAPQDKIDHEKVQSELNSLIERYSDLLSQVIAFNTESSIGNPVNGFADAVVEKIPSKFGLGILKSWLVSPITNYVAKPTFNFINRKITQGTVNVAASPKDISNLINTLLQELFNDDIQNEKLLVNITDVVVEALRKSALKLNRP